MEQEKYSTDHKHKFDNSYHSKSVQTIFVILTLISLSVWVLNKMHKLTSTTEVKLAYESAASLISKLASSDDWDAITRDKV